MVETGAISVFWMPSGMCLNEAVTTEACSIASF